jgi:hypothetical protein
VRDFRYAVRIPGYACMHILLKNYISMVRGPVVAGWLQYFLFFILLFIFIFYFFYFLEIDL